jgi:flagellin
MDVRSLFRGDYGPDGISVETALQAQDLIGQVDDALRTVGRANLHVGAFKNSMDRTLDLTRSTHTAIRNAYSIINDADMAMEATLQARRNILLQAGYAMLAQANSMNSLVLQLLR